MTHLIPPRQAGGHSRRIVIAACVLLMGAGAVACSDDDPSASPSGSFGPSGSTPSTAATAEPTSTSGATLEASNQEATGRSYLAFGDSWPYGAHCNGCTPFPDLYAHALDAESPTKFTNLTTDGGTTDSLLESIRTDDSYGAAIADADIIVISTGGNDMEPASENLTMASCGPPDGIGCFRDVAEAWGRNMDAILAEIDELRAGLPTAVRVLSMSNEFLGDPGLLEFFGPAFAQHGGARLVAWQKRAFCRASARHHDVCIDLRPVLNGPKLDEPQDVNTQEAMQLVADSLIVSGLSELAQS
jgi:lysophospholipase L1-like esterase